MVLIGLYANRKQTTVSDYFVARGGLVHQQDLIDALDSGDERFGMDRPEFITNKVRPNAVDRVAEGAQAFAGDSLEVFGVGRRSDEANADDIRI